MFKEEPIEYIRNLYNYTQTVKNHMKFLLHHLSGHQEEENRKHKTELRLGTEVDFINKFIQFIVKNLDEYNASEFDESVVVDWRIKDALM